jgi:DNA-binding phage protein
MIVALTRSHESATIERFQRDPDFAAEYLAAILIDGEEGEIVEVLKLVKKRSV